MLYTYEWIRVNYDKANAAYFSGKLPPASQVDIEINKLKNPWGRGGCKLFKRDFDGNFKAYYPVLKLSNYYDTSEHDKLEILIHEMCHIYEYFVEPEDIIECKILGRWTKKRPKHGHGRVFYEQAERMAKFGFNVQRFVDNVIMNNAELSDDTKRKLSKRFESGVHVFLMHLRYKSKHGEWVYASCLDSKYPEWKRWFEESQWGLQEYDYVEEYKTIHDKFITKKSTKVGLGYFMSIPKDEFINKYNMEYVDVVREDDRGRAHRLANMPQKVEEPVNVQEPTSTPQPKEDIIPIFRFKTVQGNVIEFRNVTRDELRRKLQERLPKWSPENIERVMNKKEYYPISEKKLREKIRESILEYADNMNGVKRSAIERKYNVQLPDEFEGNVDFN